MSKYQDQNYLLAEQYRDDTNLQARIFLHRQFSTNKYSWFRWVFDHFTVPEESEILELGCGPGDLWVENIDRIPGSWQIVLSDFSAGMLRKAIGNLGGLSEKFQFRVIDAQAIPYPGEQFEAVIANFMLYHVPERGRALSEIQRVLKRGGRLYAATVGEKHMQELFDLVARFDASLVADHQAEKNGFTLENGYSQLIRWFGKVKVHRQENALLVTETEPLVNYVISSFQLGVAEERRQELKRFVKQEIADSGGAIRITKAIGMFEAEYL